MKLKNIRSIAVVSLILISTISCKKDSLLDTMNKGTLDEVSQWQSEASADLFLNRIYQDNFRIYIDQGVEDYFGDDFTNRVYFNAYKWHAGITDPSSPSGAFVPEAATVTFWYNDWPASYGSIRACNTFILNIKKNKANYSSEYVEKRIDECRFLRARLYSELLIHYGGVPLITEPQQRQLVTADELQLPRNTFEETYNFIINELDTVLSNGKLVVKYNGGDPDAGRVTLGAALQQKAYMQLYAASPAFNSSSPAVNDPNNLQHFASPDPSRWATAAATSKKFIDTWGHKGSGDYNFFDINNIFWEQNEYNSEVIWDRQYVPYIMPIDIDIQGGPTNCTEVGGNGDSYWTEMRPTQALIDHYQMANGKYITDPGSGYDETNPYAGREKRFYKDVVYDNMDFYRTWMTKPIHVLFRIDAVNRSVNQIDFAGLDDGTTTGYNWQKQVGDKVPAQNGGDGKNWIIYRYSEVLLQYAEAQNEAVGPDASVYEAVNAIRTRPGVELPELSPGLTQDQMRDAIKNERRIELAFENKRFRDLIRWKDAEIELIKPVMGMKCYNTVPNDNSGVWKYEKFELINGIQSVFKNRMYFCPIPQTAMDRNHKLIQNSDY